MEERRYTEVSEWSSQKEKFGRTEPGGCRKYSSDGNLSRSSVAGILGSSLVGNNNQKDVDRKSSLGRILGRSSAGRRLERFYARKNTDNRGQKVLVRQSIGGNFGRTSLSGNLGSSDAKFHVFSHQNITS